MIILENIFTILKIDRMDGKILCGSLEIRIL